MILETFVFKKSNHLMNADKNSFINIFTLYIDTYLNWAALYYSELVLQSNNFKMLPATLRGAIYFSNAITLKKRDNFNACIKNLKLSVAECPLYKDIVKLVIKQLIEGDQP
ncbi:hypothetical protein SDC9_191915 [bioreactor metagenome]|uniref:Uncharacterized protein n=1 Tax=bioreactor metagenome TaxID=1076179 RepID=A0A645HZK2_9ZZZZ